MNVTGLLYCVFLNNHFYFTKTPKRPGPSLSANSKTEEGREDRQIGPSVQEDIAQAATLLAKTWTKSKPTKLERSYSSVKKKIEWSFDIIYNTKSLIGMSYKL